MDLSRLSPSPSSGLINLLVEIPAGSRNKYSYSHSSGVMRLDRVLHSSIRYPFDYGIVPNTLAPDGAPLDAMVIMAEPTFAGCLLRARPIGLLDLREDNVDDAKLLCGGFSHAKMALLYVYTSRSIPAASISSNRYSAFCHLPPFSHAVMALLKLITSARPDDFISLSRESAGTHWPHFASAAMHEL